MVAKVETNPEMNAKIVSLLRFSYNPTDHYAAQRIEELEAEVETTRRVVEVARRIITLDVQDEHDVGNPDWLDAWSAAHDDLRSAFRAPGRKEKP